MEERVSEMSSMDYFQLLKLAGPEDVLALAALAVLAVDLIWMRQAPDPAAPEGGRVREHSGLRGGCVVCVADHRFWEFRQWHAGD